jgi:methylated-DNA-[protein]-cysteine S-methyltransferase
VNPIQHTTVNTPIGDLVILLDDGVVVASGFTSVEDQVGRLDATTRSRGLERRDDLGSVSQAVADYFAGDVAALDAVEVKQSGGPFLQEVWRVMREVPAGQTWTYSELAAKAGRPPAIRAAASACARNMVAPFVPCHRIVRSDGTLGGYYYGLDTKRWLLAHEAQA